MSQVKPLKLLSNGEMSFVDTAVDDLTMHSVTAESFTASSIEILGASGVKLSLAAVAGDNHLLEVKDVSGNVKAFFDKDGNLEVQNLTVQGVETVVSTVTSQGALNVSGALTVSGNVTLGNESSDTITFTAKAASDLDMQGYKVSSTYVPSATADLVNKQYVDTAVSAVANGGIQLDGTTLTSSSAGVKVSDGGITNTQVSASAAIAYSKLNLSGSLVNSDISSSAAIAYSKLALSNSIVNADVSSSAAIDYSKLALSNSLVNSDVSSSAAIAYSKLNLSGSIVNADVASNAGISWSKLSVSANQIGYVKLNLSNSIVNADVSSSAAIAYSKLNLSGAIANSDISSGAAIAYSKLALTDSIVNADISSSAAIAYSKLALSNSIVNADVSSSAAIAYSKLALSNSIVNADISSSAGIAFSKISVNNNQIGYVKLNLSNSIVNADVSSSAAIAYSKLNLTGSIVNADISNSAAIAFSKMEALSGNTIPILDGNGKIISSGLPTSYFASITGDVQAQLNSKLFLSGGTMSGAIAMGSNKITGLAAGSVSGDAVNYGQVILKDGSNAFTADQSMGTHKLTNVVDPSSAQDAATKNYVDNLVSGLSWKQAVHVASTGDVALSGSTPFVVDGHTLEDQQRLLLKDQSNNTQNGIYVVTISGGNYTLARSSDADTWNEILGAVVYVEMGTANTGSKWVNTNSGSGTLGSSAVSFGMFSAANALDGVGTTNYVAYWTAAHTLSSEQYLSQSRGGFGTNTSAFTGLVKANGGTFSAASLVDADVSASAAIAYSKLALSGSILNSDISSSAAIAYSKLALSNSIVNADISSSAAIAYSKLALSNSIVNSDISSSAAIAFSKMESLSGNTVPIIDASGVIISSGLPTSYFASITGDVQAQLNSKLFLSGGTMSGSIAMGGNSITGLATPSASGDAVNKSYVDDLVANKASDLKSVFTASGAIAAGAPVYATTTAGTIAEGDASTLQTSRLIGIAESSIADAATGYVTIAGFATVASGQVDSGAFTVGAPVYLSENAGKLTSTAPSTVGARVYQVGVATDTLSFVIDLKQGITVA